VLVTIETLIKLLAFVNCCQCQNVWLEIIIQTNWYAGRTHSERRGNSDDFN